MKTIKKTYSINEVIKNDDIDEDLGKLYQQIQALASSNGYISHITSTNSTQLKIELFGNRLLHVSTEYVIFIFKTFNNNFYCKFYGIVPGKKHRSKKMILKFMFGGTTIQKIMIHLKKSLNKIKSF